jgi:CelD/BcsL family acetyltransferase involved in cellulose biosynthesis
MSSLDRRSQRVNVSQRSAPSPPDVPARLWVEEVTDSSRLLDLAPEWNALSGGASSADFFLTWEWVSTWLDAFLDSRQLSCLVVRENSQLVGVLPLLSRPCGVLREKSSLCAAVNDETPVSGALCAGATGPTVRVLLEYLVAARPRLRLTLPRVPVGTPFHDALCVHAPSLGVGLLAQETRHSLIVDVRGSWEEYLATRSKHARREWRRKQRRLEESGRVEIALATTPADVEHVLPDLQEIERRSWKEQSGGSLSADPDRQRFYCGLARRCAERGWLRLHVLYLSGRPAAHVFGVNYGGELLALKTSYDNALASLSPGVVLMLTALEGAFREGQSAVDLLGVPSRWKAEIATGERPHVDLCLFRRGLIDCESCAVLAQRVKPFARARLTRLVGFKRKVVEHVFRRG